MVQVLICVCFHQDLKEKKLQEEKENGKDASTNGKVTSPVHLWLRRLRPLLGTKELGSD